tara:strand:- start:1674 stop:2288 length:615 start_codon:yes stop_codon:yes gene_type:complete
MNIQTIAENINKKGYFILPQYYSKEKCEQIKQYIKKTIHFSYGEGNDLRCGNFEKYSNISEEFLEDPYLLSIGEYVLGHKVDRIQKRCQLGILQYKTGNECSGGGWHVDNHNPQFKALLYVTDVTKDNGPFAIISPPITSTQYKPISENKDTRFPDSIEKDYKDSIQRLTGKAGDVILVNTQYIHRGTVIKKGERVTLTNYYYD